MNIKAIFFAWTNSLNKDDPISVLNILKCSISGELNVASTSLTVQVCEVLSKLVSMSETITKIDVSDSLLSPQALAVLLNPVKLSKIHILQLKGNNIMGPSVHRIAVMVARSQKLKL